MASRIDVDPTGRRWVVQADRQVGIEPGTRFLLIGDAFRSGERGIYWLANEKGRPPTARERATPRGHGEVARGRRQTPAIDDDQLADEAAIKAATLEQEREPADLIGREAA
jgi:hypothetical protein